MMLTVSTKATAVVIVVLLTLAGRKRTPQKPVEIEQPSVAEVKPAPVTPAPVKPAVPATAAPRKPKQADSCAGLDAYPWPRSYEQVLADALPGARKPGYSPAAMVIIGPDGNFTHLRFTRLSSSNSINRGAFEFLTKDHFKPTVLNGEPVTVCTTVDINVDF
jgi:hypothetical protein